ncbi:amyloid-beta A4 precursor protein-binding family A member 3 isoform X1 [Rhinatrema bivittatum]|uniref:amyloid-beta A4 precursor protein-binding family A member 3 isoform X1 n=1 Tax=Rhinatrema bivittatum TaxID=194408 RepID=UPI0011277B41|nr:amyloid-beta A4 precursor protein-binding family A member 3 isoform X1 [Rhinatrema bivittatum]
MAENGMDFQMGLASVPSFCDDTHPRETAELPAMDLEEGTHSLQAADRVGCTAHQPSSSLGTLQFLSLDLKTSTDEGSVCKAPGTDMARSRGLADAESPERSLRDAETSCSIVALDFDIQAASDCSACPTSCKDSARAMEDGECSAPPETDHSWKDDPKAPPQTVGSLAEGQLRSSSSVVSMELDEQPESRSLTAAEEWLKRPQDDHFQIQELLTQLQSLGSSFTNEPTVEELPACLSEADTHGGASFEAEVTERQAVQAQDFDQHELQPEDPPCPLHIAIGRGLIMQARNEQRLAESGTRQQNPGSRGLLAAEADREDLLDLLAYERVPSAEVIAGTPLARSDILTGTDVQAGFPSAESPSEDTDDSDALEMIPLRPRSSDLAFSQTSSSCECAAAEAGRSRRWCPAEDAPGCPLVDAGEEGSARVCPYSPDDSPEPAWVRMPSALSPEQHPPRSHESSDTVETLAFYSAIKGVPGPCEPEDLLDGVIFGAKYLGSTQLVSERSPSTSIRMAQAQEAVDRIKAPEGESQPMTEVDLFVSTQRIKVLTADTQEAMMDHPLQTISYIADIGSIVVFMARRKLPCRAEEAVGEKRLYKMICHVFQSADAQMIAQAIGQAFSVAYQQFLQSKGIDPSKLPPGQYSDVLDKEQLYNADLIHFSKQENCRDVCIRKQKGEILGIAVVESGWGSILPTVTIANLMHSGPAEKSGELSIGDRLMSVNGTSLVGLPLATCHNIIRDLKPLTEVTLNIVRCPPVTTAIIRRSDAKHQLGFCVEDGIICSLMRGGIAERGGIRVGHRIIEINGQSVVATPHDKIIQTLMNAIGEVHIKTMPASTYRLLTGQEQPVYL